MAIKKSFLLLVVLLFVSFTNAQSTEIYKSESKVESPEGGNYNVNVLFLYGDGTYKILWQQYSNKKMARKNILLDVSEEYGEWSKKGKAINLIPSTNSQKIEFRIKNKNKLLYVMDDGGIGSSWCRIKR